MRNPNNVRTSVALLLSMVVVVSMDAAAVAEAMVVFRNSGVSYYHSMLLSFTNVRLQRQQRTD